MVLKYENDFEISEFYRSRIFEKVGNWMKLLIFFQKNGNISRSRRESEKKKEKKSDRDDACSTSYSSGNQVDGLPLVVMKSDTKLLEKRKSRRPRTQILLTMKNMFSNVIAL